jgi:Ca2+-binding EF-hand superfamily protein|tara:strand:+ start:304 stop:624 length:321 start_codon:yes stop_codon:yes gene_type:complete
VRKTLILFASIISYILGGTGFVVADLDKMNTDSKEHFSIVDANTDGKLDFDEFNHFVDLEAEDNIGKSLNLRRFKWILYKPVFWSMDSDKDGFLTLKEIAEFEADN